jgi:hypothetical protein
LCEEGYIPSFLGDECIEPIEYCETPYQNYNNDGEDFMCPDCVQGYWPCGNECEECDIDDYCIDCLDDEICTECAMPWILNPDSTGCMEPLANCEDTRPEYELFYDRFWCDNCTVGYTWEWNHENDDTDFWSCQPCGQVIDHCVDCRQNLAINGPSERENGRCHECEDDYMPTYLKNACFLPYEHCEIEPENYNVVDDRFVCQTCSEGFYWDWEEWDCVSCSVIDDHCIECVNPSRDLNQPTCFNCNDGYMHEFDGLSCVLRFDHCSEQHVELQPTGLSTAVATIDGINRHIYVCGDCFEGYFWSEEYHMCHSCFEDCLECTSEEVCTVCKDGMMPQPDGWDCTPRIENCDIAVEDQPSGLDYAFFNDEEEELGLSSWICDPCAIGWWFDYESLSCKSCSIIQNCEECFDPFTCVRCLGN